MQSSHRCSRRDRESFPFRERRKSSGRIDEGGKHEGEKEERLFQKNPRRSHRGYTIVSKSVAIRNNSTACALRDSCSRGLRRRRKKRRRKRRRRRGGGTSTCTYMTHRSRRVASVNGSVAPITTSRSRSKLWPSTLLIDGLRFPFFYIARCDVNVP